MNRTIAICALLIAMGVVVFGCGTNPQYSAKLNIPEQQSTGDGLFYIDEGESADTHHGFAKAYYQRGLEYARKSDHYHAIIEFEHALSVDSEYADAWYAKAISCEAVGETAFALKAYNAFIKFAAPDDKRLETAKAKIAQLEKKQK